MTDKKTWKFRVRPIRIDGDIAYVSLPDGNEAIIDADMAEAVGQWNWHLGRSNGSNGRTVRRALNPKYQSLADLISPPPLGLVNDHIDRDPLNNLRSNLRHCTQQQNCFNRKRMNATGYAGVSRHGGCWRARITINGQRSIIGLFATPEEAAKAYDNAARIAFGEFASLNFPDAEAADGIAA